MSLYRRSGPSAGSTHPTELSSYYVVWHSSPDASGRRGEYLEQLEVRPLTAAERVAFALAVPFAFVMGAFLFANCVLLLLGFQAVALLFTLAVLVLGGAVGAVEALVDLVRGVFNRAQN